MIFHLSILEDPRYESEVQINHFNLDDLKVFFVDSEEGKETLVKLTSAIHKVSIPVERYFSTLKKIGLLSKI